MADAEPVHLFSSARYDPALVQCADNSRTSPASTPSAFLLLPYHRDRLHAAARAFLWTDAANALEGDAGLAKLRGELERAVAAYEVRVGAAGAPLKVREPCMFNPGHGTTQELMTVQ